MSQELVGKSLSVHPSARIIEFAFVFFVAALGLTFWLFADREWFTFVWRIVVGIGLVWIGYLFLARITSIYSINAIEVSIETGIISKRRRSAPLNRITNFEVNRPILKRLLGLADLHIDTAGGAEIEIELIEMKGSDATEFQNFLSWHLAAQKVADAHGSPELRADREAALDQVSKRT